MDPGYCKVQRQRGGGQWVYPCRAVALHAVWVRSNAPPHVMGRSAPPRGSLRWKRCLLAARGLTPELVFGPAFSQMQRNLMLALEAGWLEVHLWRLRKRPAKQ